MTKNCIICGKKLRPLTLDWKDRNTHLNCSPIKKKKEQQKLRRYIEEFKRICKFDDWDYDYENNRIIYKRI